MQYMANYKSWSIDKAFETAELSKGLSPSLEKAILSFYDKKKKKCLQRTANENHQNTQTLSLCWDRNYSGGAGMSTAERNVTI